MNLLTNIFYLISTALLIPVMLVLLGSLFQVLLLLGQTAKRRSYGVIVSHLTPPFTDAGLYGELERLHELIHEFDYSDDAPLKHELRRSITDAVRQLDMNADLGLSGGSLDDRLLDDAEIVHLHDYLHELKQSHIPDGLHVIGRPYQKNQIRDTAAAMLGSRGWETVQALLESGEGGAPDAVEQQSALMRECKGEILCDLRFFAFLLVSTDSPSAEWDSPKSHMFSDCGSGVLKMRAPCSHLL